MRALLLLPLAAALAFAVPASGAALKPWIGFDGSYGKYTMGDVNRDLEDLNTGLKQTRLTLWPISGGPGVGLSAGLDFGRGLSVGVGYDRLFASSGAEDPNHLIRYRLPAHALRGIAEYAFPRKGPLGARIGVAGGLVAESGSIVIEDSSDDVTGSAPLFETYLAGEWWGQRRCGLFATVGYRHARLTEVKIGGSVAHNPPPDGSNYTLDFSGMLVRVGFRIPLAAAPAAKAGP
jgi:hypothetical protein